MFPFEKIECDPVAPFHDRPHKHMTREQRDAIVNRPLDLGPMLRTREQIEMRKRQMATESPRVYTTHPEDQRPVAEPMAQAIARKTTRRKSR